MHMARGPHCCTGRLLIAQGAVDACKIGASIAIRYSCKRPQFGEKMIMQYITQQRRLLPGLATTYAMQISMRRLRVGCLTSPKGWPPASYTLKSETTCAKAVDLRLHRLGDCQVPLVSFCGQQLLPCGTERGRYTGAHAS